MSLKDPESSNLPSNIKKSQWTRREWLQQAAMAAVLLPQDYPGGFGGWGGRGRGRFRPRRTVDPSQIPAYKYRILPVSRFPSLQNEYNTARSNTQLGSAKLYRDQIVPLNFKVPADFTGAKSVIVVAVYSKNMYSNFMLDGNSYRVMVPFQYYNDDLNSEKLKAILQKEVIKSPGRRVVDISSNVPLKLLAARSGLGHYARNSLIFVDGMGSYNMLYAFLTDQPFTEDHWTELRILEECNHCHACVQTCPTRCINRWNYSVNIDKCLTLFNENPGEFPNFIYGSMHHALMGCMKCKEPCPANEGIAELSGKLEDVSEEETRKILKGAPDDALLKSLQRKLRQFKAAASREQFPILKRNLSVLIRA
ncbi:MAG: epoxyqueuosine reductase [Acidobacteria bacterium]|nr:epoxyqueuosine reductase [Acidobacteriota bacterium]